MRHGKGQGPLKGAYQDAANVRQDEAFKLYIATLGSRRNNNGIVNNTIIHQVGQAVVAFLRFADLPITPTTIADLVQYKRLNPLSTNIERAITAFSQQPSIPQHANQASRILGIFRANYAPLQARVNTHFPPAEENCTRGIFTEIYKQLNQEQRDMIQWGLYVPERAKAAYRIPFEDIDTSRKDFAIVLSRGSRPNALGIRNKMRVDHICLPPVDFAKRIIANAQAAGNNCVFPTHEWLWTQITAFALREHGVRLVSNYTRKLFLATAEDTTLKPSRAAFIMGDKTRLQHEGVHMDLIYNPGLRPMERQRFIEDYARSGLTEKLDLSYQV